MTCSIHGYIEQKLSDYACPIANRGPWSVGESKEDIGIALRYLPHQLVPLTSS